MATDVDGAYYRAVVESIDATSGAVGVRFLDFGNTNSVEKANCLPASSDIARLPTLGFWAPLDEELPYDTTGAASPEAITAITSQPEVVIRLSANAGVVEVLTADGQDLLKALNLPNKKSAPKAVNPRADKLPLCAFVPAPDAAQPAVILITDVQSLQRVYVQCLTDDFAAASEALALLMGATLDPVQSEIQAGDLLAVPFIDGCLYRAEVLSLQVCDRVYRGKAKNVFSNF